LPAAAVILGAAIGAETTTTLFRFVPGRPVVISISVNSIATLVSTPVLMLKSGDVPNAVGMKVAPDGFPAATTNR
jgi:hypothetical protein